MSLVFVDVDDTLIKGVAALYLVDRYSSQYGLLNCGKVLLGVAKELTTFANLFFQEKILHQDIDDNLLKVTSMSTYTKIKDRIILDERYFETLMRALNKEVLESARSHNLPIIIMSASLQEVIDLLVERLNFAAGFGSDYSNGEFLFGEGKYQKAVEVCKSKNIDLKDCYFYTDSVSDLKLLNEVNNRFLVLRKGETMEGVRKPYKLITIE